MPVTLTLQKKLTDRHWLAVGAYKSKHTALCGPAEMILMQTDKGLVPVLDSSLYPSTVLHRPVTSYLNAPVVDVAAETGKRLTINSFMFTLKNEDKK